MLILPKFRENSQSRQRDRTLQKRQPTLNDSDLFSLLDERLRPEFKQALKTLPPATKKQLRDAATAQTAEGRAIT